jgi:nitroimidazol reductase NimA-like FMN-containing flavoprotein (pyridoxamine 5'-phosphate oxidase superfamily)
MLKWLVIAVMSVSVFVAVPAGFARDQEWPEGGPGYIYVTPTGKSPFHMPYDEGMKCVDCHRWDGVDAYTAATMTLTKSTVGRLSQPDIKQAVLEALKGKGDYREMYVMATAFDNEPLASCLEFTLDPETLHFYASSEKQTEKLFHLAANPRASLVYVRARNDMRYFVDPTGVQVVGTAVLLKHGDPGFGRAAALCLETAMHHMPEEMTSRMSPEAMLASIRKNQLITQVIPERIVITSGEFVNRGLHRKQIWEAQAP